MKEYNLDFSVDLLKSILWQYNDATRLKSLIEAKNNWIKLYHTDFWQDWVKNVFDLNTANDFGLSVWAIILGVSREVNITTETARPVFGFGSFNRNFFDGNFGPTQGAISMSTEQYRLLLKSRLLQFNCDGTIPSINKILSIIFPNNKAYAIDGYNMTINYIFQNTPTSQEMFVIENSGILLRPAGVGYRIVAGIANNFGFGQYHMNFYKGNFYKYGA